MKKVNLLFVASIAIALQCNAQKRKQNNPNVLKINNGSEIRTSEFSNHYFFTKILYTNDTVKIAETMKNRNLDFNMPTDFPREDPSTIFQHAVKNCNSQTIEFMLRNGANPNLITYFKPCNNFGECHDVYSNSPLYFTEYNIEKVKVLVKYGLDLDANKEMLMERSKHGNFKYKEYISSLYGGRVDPGALVFMALDPFENKYITPDLIKDYIKRGANVNANTETENYMGQSLAKPLLSVAIERGLSYDVIKTLLESGANPNICKPRSSFEDSSCPIHVAICRRDLSIIKLLVEYKADINAKGSGCGTGTPLTMANQKGYSDIADYLYSIGAH